MGFFVVIEGIDGAGGETQSKLLKQFLEKKGKKVELVKYPDYEGPIGKLIHDFLHKKFDISSEVQFCLYASDMVKDKEKIKKALKEGKIVIADRYLTSTLAYQTLKGFPLDKGLEFAKLFELLTPDLVIFIEISPETSIKRKFKEKNNLDRHEANKDFLRKVNESYHNLIENKIFAKEWIVIDGEKPIEEVAKKIQKIVLSRL